MNVFVFLNFYFYFYYYSNLSFAFYGKTYFRCFSTSGEKYCESKNLASGLFNGFFSNNPFKNKFNSLL